MERRDGREVVWAVPVWPCSGPQRQQAHHSGDAMRWLHSTRPSFRLAKPSHTPHTTSRRQGAVITRTMTD